MERQDEAIDYVCLRDLMMEEQGHNSPLSDDHKTESGHNDVKLQPLLPTY